VGLGRYPESTIGLTRSEAGRANRMIHGRCFQLI
jgi:hypothetical protein